MLFSGAFDFDLEKVGPLDFGGVLVVFDLDSFLDVLDVDDEDLEADEVVADVVEADGLVGAMVVLVIIGGDDLVEGEGNVSGTDGGGDMKLLLLLLIVLLY